MWIQNVQKKQIRIEVTAYLRIRRSIVVVRYLDRKQRGQGAAAFLIQVTTSMYYTDSLADAY